MSKNDVISPPVVAVSPQRILSSAHINHADDNLNSVEPMSDKPVGQWSGKGKTKSRAQVARFVSQQAVGQRAGGLKPKGSRAYRIVIRFTQAERAKIVRHAQDARLTVSPYVRLVLLNDPGLDPARHWLLMRLNYQLSRHGTNLNQIAKQLNAGDIAPEQASHAVEALRQEFSDAYSDVGKALANGRSYHDEA